MRTNYSENKYTWYQKMFLDLREIVLVLTVFMLIYVLCFRTVVVSGSSMKDTLHDGDRLILISSFLYPEPKQGDVVVASKDSFRNGECIIKRVIATEGQTVDINFDTGEVYVDEVLLDEEYIYSGTYMEEGMSFPLTVADGCVFVMGDNRMESLDSRNPVIGMIDCREILGRAVLLLLPGRDPVTGAMDFSRIGVID